MKIFAEALSQEARRQLTQGLGRRRELVRAGRELGAAGRELGAAGRELVQRPPSWFLVATAQERSKGEGRFTGRRGGEEVSRDLQDPPPRRRRTAARLRRDVAETQRASAATRWTLRFSTISRMRFWAGGPPGTGRKPHPTSAKGALPGA
jgi:hypothetical protein